MIQKLMIILAFFAINITLAAEPKDLPPLLAEAVVTEDGKLVVEVPTAVWKNISSEGKVRIKDIQVNVKIVKISINRLVYHEASAIAENARNRVMDLNGNVIPPEDVVKIFKDKKHVLLSISGKYPDSFYLNAYKDDLMVVVPGIVETGALTKLLPKKGTDEDFIVGSWVNDSGIGWIFGEDKKLTLVAPDGRLLDIYSYKINAKEGHLDIYKGKGAWLKTLLCLYEFKDGKLKICQSIKSGDYRPANIDEKSARADNCVLTRTE